MRLRYLLVCVAVGIVSYAMTPLSAQEQGENDGVEVLARGPLHEAFASATTLTPQAGLIVKTTPPEDIEEVPPDQKPEGSNIAWIPGYWGWDDERDVFIWISGTWRAIPPERQWIAGYWSKDDGNYQWISGYWANAEVAEVRYYPEPPKTQERGPSSEPPSVEHVWIPGVWLWNEGRYAWRPGYWMVPQANWVWVPSTWVWTPAGCVFVDGYWDYAIPRRGIVFAPIYVTRQVYTRPNYVYTPRLVLNPAIFVSHMFLRPAYQHYYFGDYYAANYSSLGIYPQYTYQYRYGFDPLFAQQTWQHRDDRNWLVSVQQNYARLAQDEAARPPRTFDPRWVSANLEGEQAANVMATSLTQVTKSSSFTSYRFERMAEVERRQVAGNAQEMRQQRQERQQVVKASAKTDATVKTGAKTEPVTVKLKRSPISAANIAATAGTRSTEGAVREALKPGATGREPGTAEPREPGAREPRPKTAREPGDVPRDPLPEPGAKAKGKGPPPSREPKPRADIDPKDPFTPKEPKATKEPMTPKEPRTPKEPLPGDQPPPNPEKEPMIKGKPPAAESSKNPPKPDREKSPREGRDLDKPKSGAPKGRPMTDEDPAAPRPEPRGKARPEPSEPKGSPPKSPPTPKEPTPKAPTPKDPPKVERDPVKPVPPGRGSEPKPPKGDKDKDKDKEPKKKEKPEKSPETEPPK